MIPAIFIFKFNPDISLLMQPVNLLNILFLGLGASAVCFATWNVAVKILGAVTTSVYIYTVPVVTVITSIIILHEKVTGTAILGIILTLAGLFISQNKIFIKREGALQNE